jgi:hypothetical protein
MIHNRRGSNLPEVKIQYQFLVASNGEAVESGPTVWLDCGSLMKELKSPWLVVTKVGDKTLGDNAQHVDKIAG